VQTRTPTRWRLSHRVSSAVVATALAASALLATASHAAPTSSEDLPENEIIGPDVPTEPSPIGEATREYIVVARDDSGLDQATAFLEAKGFAPLGEWNKAVDGLHVRLTASVADALRRQPFIASVERNVEMSIDGTQSNPPSWGIDRIDQRTLPLSSSFTSSVDGSGVKIYVIDTGVKASHNEFGGRVVDGASYAFANGNTSDCNGHGTHVAGTAAGSTVGVAKQATIVPVKVLDCDGSGSTVTVIYGINWVIADHRAGEPAVANLSLGGGASPALDAAIDSLVEDGVTVVVAAGNEYDPACYYSPARAPRAITVAASTSSDTDAYFSNFGSCVDIYAPGAAIYSSTITSDSSYESWNGTSMASPHVAGAAALVLGASPRLSPAQVWSSLEASSTKGRLTWSWLSYKNPWGFDASTEPNKLLFVDSPPSYTLSVGTAGAGSGSVNSSPGSVNCGASCSDTFISGTSVTLTATPATGSVFGGWSGACTGVGSCSISMDQDRSVTATFNPVPTYTLTVIKAGSGSGTVAETRGSLSCSSTCTSSTGVGLRITLRATPAPGSTFAGWSGACRGQGVCQVTMSQARSVTATFTAVPTYTLTVVKAGPGSGSVVASPGGLDCGDVCSSSYAKNTKIVLSAVPVGGSRFLGWSGACGGRRSCQVTMSQARSVTATFG